MKKLYTLLFTFGMLFAANQLLAQTLWIGSKIVFEKTDGADWTMEANQDRLTDNVWITRANNKGLFNIAINDEHIGNGANVDNLGPSPVGTEWAFGTLADGIENLDFTSWREATVITGSDGEPGSVPNSLVGQDMVLHLVDDDIYIDIKLLSWSIGNQGGQGGFSYERSTDEVTNINEVQAAADALSVFPNPAQDMLTVKNVNKLQDIVIFDALGRVVQQGRIDASDQIAVANLAKGVYLLRMEDGRSTTFVKQ
ncbi:MAG: T9SS type A sorting domain-containing protein [Bacteroidota bacterium]